MLKLICLLYRVVLEVTLSGNDVFTFSDHLEIDAVYIEMLSKRFAL